ncbi:Cytochrome b561 [Bos mutus]|uniref:Transmembrane ascorbate-dependent reductase CYB561 n=1 Tax=Bos mutus TaxID=72004 RepID=L8HZK9_9CETA|nr:Cytochrome b561 [Bos mutus]
MWRILTCTLTAGGSAASSRLSMEGPASPARAPGALPYYVAFSQLLGLIVVAMTGAWLGMYRGGIAWESALQFNVHPLCMIIGLVFLQGDALLVYRVFRNEAKRTTKVLHGLLHVFAFVIALVGLVAVFEHHRKKGYADLYSLHSWCGILVFALFFAQVSPRVPTVAGRGREQGPNRLRPAPPPGGSVRCGRAGAFLRLGGRALGLRATPQPRRTKYSMFEPEGVLANVLGLLLATFATVILYILTRADWKRPLQAEEQALSMDFKTLTEGDSPSSQ